MEKTHPPSLKKSDNILFSRIAAFVLTLAFTEMSVNTAAIYVKIVFTHGLRSVPGAPAQSVLRFAKISRRSFVRGTRNRRMSVMAAKSEPVVHFVVIYTRLKQLKKNMKQFVAKAARVFLSPRTN